MTHVDSEDKRLLKADEMPTLKMSNYGAYVINESGLYSLILSSKLPTAKKSKLPLAVLKLFSRLTA